MSSVTITNSCIDTANWYQTLTFTIENASTAAVDLRQAVIRFTASGHIDPWGNFTGDAIDSQNVILNTLAQPSGELNEITLNQKAAFWLAAGEQCTLTCSLSATSVPVSFELLGISLSGEETEPSQGDDETEVEDQEQETTETDVEPDAGVDVLPVTGEGVTISCSAVDAQSWYQSVTFTVKNGYNQAVDMRQSLMTFAATAHVDPYSAMTGELVATGAPVLASDGGWPKEINRITLSNKAPLWLGAGESATLTFALSTVQTPVSIDDLQLTLVNDPARQASIELVFPAMLNNGGTQPAVVVVSPEGKSTSCTGRWGETLTLDGLYAGNWLINVDTLENDAICLQPQQSTRIVALSSSADCQRYEIAYLPAVYFAQAELVLDDIPDMQGACVSVELWRGGSQPERTVDLIFGQSQRVKKLFAGERYELQIVKTTINNIIISTLSTPESFIPLAEQPAYGTVKYKKANVNTSAFVTLNVTVSGLPAGAPAQRYVMRSKYGKGDYQYSLVLSSDSVQQPIPMPVMTGQYNVASDSFYYDNALWVTDFPGSYSIVDPVNHITLSHVRGVDLQVRGWPAYVAHGGVTVNAAETTSAYAGVPVDALFKYDGFDGGGDPLPAKEVDINGDGFLDYDLLPIHRTAALTRKLEAQSGRAVMPVMVVYTANASGGSAITDLQDPQRLRNHFGNFITQCLAAQSWKDEQHPVPATFVLNPDFLGAMQQEPYGYTAVRQANSMPVNAQLAVAVHDLTSVLTFSAPSLPAFSDDIYGYLQAVNFIVHRFAPDVAFGWQTNVWATGTADWLLRDNANPQAQGEQISAFINELGVYQGQYAPDFIVFDKFERDCFSPDALAHYGWNATAWQHYLAMVKATTQGLNVPAMIWQIPGGHMPTAEEGTTLIASNHFASGGTFLMGDERIGSNVRAISRELLDTPLNKTTYGATTVGEWLAKDAGYDWGQPQVMNLPDYHIFSVLWGGGSTVSITTIHSNGDDGGWLAQKMSEYYRSPRSLY